MYGVQHVGEANARLFYETERRPDRAPRDIRICGTLGVLGIDELRPRLLLELRDRRFLSIIKSAMVVLGI